MIAGCLRYLLSLFFIKPRPSPLSATSPPRNARGMAPYGRGLIGSTHWSKTSRRVLVSSIDCFSIRLSITNAIARTSAVFRLRILFSIVAGSSSIHEFGLEPSFPNASAIRPSVSSGVSSASMQNRAITTATCFVYPYNQSRDVDRIASRFSLSFLSSAFRMGSSEVVVEIAASSLASSSTYGPSLVQ